MSTVAEDVTWEMLISTSLLSCVKVMLLGTIDCEVLRNDSIMCVTLNAVT